MGASIASAVTRVRMDEKLRESEKRYHVLFEQAADSILLLESAPDGTPVIRDANSATSRRLGYTRDELLGQPVSWLEAEAGASQAIAARRQKFKRRPENFSSYVIAATTARAGSSNVR